MRDLRSRYLRRPVAGIDYRSDTGCICPIPTNDADELFHVMSTDGEDWPAGGSAELRRAECIGLLGGAGALARPGPAPRPNVLRSDGLG